jgi:RNA polymerase sigma-70 factor (ECF subfamily)
MSTTDSRRRFDTLFERHFRALLGYALRRVLDPADAADVVAETFLVAWRRIDKVPPEPEDRLWLFGVARRTLGNRRRGDRRREALAERLRQQLATAPKVHEDVDETALVVRQAMALLRPDDREILSLVAWEGLAPHEAGAVLGLQPATSRVRLHRARARMRDALISLGWEPEPDGRAAVAAIAPLEEAR